MSLSPRSYGGRSNNTPGGYITPGGRVREKDRDTIRGSIGGGGAPRSMIPPAYMSRSHVTSQDNTNANMTAGNSNDSRNHGRNGDNRQQTFAAVPTARRDRQEGAVDLGLPAFPNYR